MFCKVHCLAYAHRDLFWMRQLLHVAHTIVFTDERALQSSTFECVYNMHIYHIYTFIHIRSRHFATNAFIHIRGAFVCTMNCSYRRCFSRRLLLECREMAYMAVLGLLFRSHRSIQIQFILFISSKLEVKELWLSTGSYESCVCVFDAEVVFFFIVSFSIWNMILINNMVNPGCSYPATIFRPFNNNNMRFHSNHEWEKNGKIIDHSRLPRCDESNAVVLRLDLSH